MPGRAIVVAFTSRKGGVGKTVCASLLARHFAENEGKRVVVVDFDACGGITSVFYDQPLTDEDLTITELMQLASDNIDIRDAFNEAIIPTDAENNPLWKNNGGHISLVPSNESLDQAISHGRPDLLRDMLINLDLSDEYILLVDTGPEHKNVSMGICAANLVFLPLMFSRQDVYPAIDTLLAVVQEQKRGGTAVLGGLVINDYGDTQWEREYKDNFARIFYAFKERTGLVSISDDIFIHLKRSKLIKRGKYLDWTFREEFKKAAEKMASAVQAYQGLAIGMR